MTVATSQAKTDQAKTDFLFDTATRLRIHSVRSTTRQRPRDQLRVRGGDHVGSILLGHALRPG